MKGLLMKPEKKSKKLLAITRAKAKMYEYHVPEEHHIDLSDVDVTNLFDITIGILGDFTYSLNLLQDLDNENQNVLFSARYFDALQNSNLTPDLNYYLKILGAASYSLAGYPGSANVIIKDLLPGDADASELDKLLLNLIKIIPIDGNFNQNNPYFREIETFLNSYNNFINTGTNSDELLTNAKHLKTTVYSYGNDRDLLFSDIIEAICSSYVKQSLWKALPFFSGLTVDSWREYINRETNIKTLWPAQDLIGQNDVFKGASAVIQMPTSAGKTKSISFIIRSSFYSGRNKLAVVVAPYRALCQEIYNNFYEEFSADQNTHVNLVSDVLQYDFDELEQNSFYILILTPEKLDYILRHNSRITTSARLIIYDEGHLFDDSSRGARYELLLTSLKQKLNASTQVILISAVLPNASDIGKWLIGEDCKIVKGENLYPTVRNISFVNWTQPRGRLSFRNAEDYNEEDFFVPRILLRQQLQLRGRETRERFFPDPESPSNIALALACKVVSNGAVAIFAGRKDSASKILLELVDAFERGVDLEKPSNYSNEEELHKFVQYIENVLGLNSVYHKASKIGMFCHHASIPQGLRLCTEFAISKNKIKAVVCTSTLAQGVNLPIRYLIISTTQQSSDTIKTKDFHNLLGRAGRSNKFTEGTVIFSDRVIFDLRHNVYEGWRWNKTLKLLDPKEQDLCRSRLLTIFDEMPETFDRDKWLKNINSVKNEINQFLLYSFSELENLENIREMAINLAKNTLGYYQANENEKRLLEEIFLEMAQDIFTKEPDINRRKIFAKSILSLEKSQQLLELLQGKVEFLNEAHNINDILLEIFEIIYEYSPSIHRSITTEKLLTSCKMWINGDTFPEILNYLKNEKFGKRKAKIEHIVKECESVFGFEGSLLIGSIIELLELVQTWNGSNKNELLLMQKMLKYGLPTQTQIRLYELGFTDRKLCVETSTVLVDQNILSEILLKDAVRNNRDNIVAIINNYPSYFNYVFNNLLPLVN